MANCRACSGKTTVDVNVNCPRCAGSGQGNSTGGMCQHCSGQGKVTETRTCPRCNGSGED